MTPERWKRVREVLGYALELPDDRRAAYLDGECAGDVALRMEVESLLNASTGEAILLDRPILRRPLALQPGDIVGRYQVIEKSGEGGMGAVYKARDTRLGRLVALKLLHSGQPAPRKAQHGLDREARVLSALNHPGIVTIHELIEHEGWDVIVMEFVDGEPLDRILKRGPLPVESIVNLGIGVADALAKAHAVGVVHRDLKPGNILVNSDGFAKIVDFGIAKLLDAQALGLESSGVIAGTASYMAPEQTSGKRSDARADIFTFGSVLYEMATGNKAFNGTSPARTMQQVRETDPPPVAGPPALAALVARCLRKHPDDRFQSMEAVRRELELLREPKRKTIDWRIAFPAAAVLLAAAGYLAIRATAPTPMPQLIRFSPPGEWLYSRPVISPDGKTVAMLSNRGSSFEQLWAQTRGQNDLRQLTHAPHGVSSPSFAAGGGTLVYVRLSRLGEGEALESISISGGAPRVLLEHAGSITSAAASPDGRHVAWHDAPRAQLMKLDLATAAIDTIAPLREGFAWAPDSKRIVHWDDNSGDWVVRDLSTKSAMPTGLRGALGVAAPEARLMLFHNGSAIFRVIEGEETRTRAVSVSLDTLTARGKPRQLTFGTERESVTGASADGLAVVQVRDRRADLYSTPLDAAAGRITGETRRETADGRMKTTLEAWHQPGLLTFRAPRSSMTAAVLRDRSGRESEAAKAAAFVVTSDGHAAVETRGGAVFASNRQICAKCGEIAAPSPEPNFVFTHHNGTVHRLDLNTGQSQQWLSEPTRIHRAGFFGSQEKWLIFSTGVAGTKTYRWFVAPWNGQPVQRAEWIEVPEGLIGARAISGSDRFYFHAGEKLLSQRFDPKTRRFGDAPEEVAGVVAAPGESWAIGPERLWQIRTATRSSVWLMQLPE